MSPFRLTAAALIAAVGALSAQAPKPAPPRLKYTAAQITEAENKLAQANCGLHHEELPPLVPNGRPEKGPVDIVAFPVDMTDAELAKLIPMAIRLPKLTTVEFSGTMKVTEKGFKEVAKLIDLRALFLDGCKVDGDILKVFTALPQLQWLDLSRSTVNDRDLIVLSSYPMLSSLSLEDVPGITAKGVTNLQDMVRLRTLNISVDEDPTGMMAEVGKIDRLVELHAYPVGDLEAKEVGKLTRLQVLDLNNRYAYWRGRRAAAAREKPGMAAKEKPAVVAKKPNPMVGRRAAFTGISSVGFPNLLKCTELRVLKLAGHPVNVNGSGLDRLEFLQELDLSGTDFDDDGVSWLGRLKGLKKLWLSSTGVTIEGVKGLAVAGGLEMVALDYLPLTDEAIRHLARNRKLKELSLNETRVACSDRSAWAGLARLERVYLERTNVTDSTLMNLASLKTLKLVDATMNCPNVTPAGAAALERELLGAHVLAYDCQRYWPGGGGVPVPRPVRQPDLSTPNLGSRPSSNQTSQPPMAPPKAPPPAVRNVPLPGSGKP